MSQASGKLGEKSRECFGLFEVGSTAEEAMFKKQRLGERMNKRKIRFRLALKVECSVDSSSAYLSKEGFEHIPNVRTKE